MGAIGKGYGSMEQCCSSQTIAKQPGNIENLFGQLTAIVSDNARKLEQINTILGLRKNSLDCAVSQEVPPIPTATIGDLLNTFIMELEAQNKCLCETEGVLRENFGEHIKLV